MTYDLEPLRRAHGGSWRAFRETVRTDTPTLRRVEEHGLSEAQADAFAIRCGFHPAEIWGIAWLSS